MQEVVDSNPTEGTKMFEPTTSCIRGKRLTTRPQGPHAAHG